MKEVTLYICDTCGAQFYSRESCAEHEVKCYPCNKCKHQYFVYGCEEECDYRRRRKCNGSDERSLNFKAKFFPYEDSNLERIKRGEGIPPLNKNIIGDY